MERNSFEYKNVHKTRKPPSEIERVGISALLFQYFEREIN